MDIGDGIAAVALVVSLLAVAASLRAAEQARRANELNLAQDKMRIYEAFYSVHMHQTSRAMQMNVGIVDKLAEVATRADLILPESLSTALSKYHYDMAVHCSKLLVKDTDNPFPFQEVLAEAVSLRLQGQRLAKDLKANLRRSIQDNWNPET
uniref:Uncharacterized protein n=2 Tax=viral metagenome TaxID=1070528 RepID=A0A6M3XUK1_9ZZZZ